MFSRMAAKSPPVGYTVQMGGGGGKERFLVYSCCTMNNSQAIKTPLTASSLARPSGSQKIDACRVLHIRCKQENTGDDVVGSRGSSILDHSTAKRPVSLIPCKGGGGGAIRHLAYSCTRTSAQPQTHSSLHQLLVAFGKFAGQWVCT